MKNRTNPKKEKRLGKPAADKKVITTPTPVKKHVRPSWDEYFISIAELVGTRATCDRGRSGCVIVRDRRILVTGYVGSPIGMQHCDEVGHEMHKVINVDGTESQHCIRTVHAEENAIAQAARMGIALDSSTLYCHMTPCYNCAKTLVNAGIKRIVCSLDYHQGGRSKSLFEKAGVELNVIKNAVESYENQ